MDDGKTLERRIQLRGHSFVLTIPRTVIKKMRIRDGQSVRFLVRDGEIVIKPMSAEVGGGTANPAGPDEYERAVTEMVARDRSEKAKEHRRGGAASGRSKLERLRLK
ncbi:MAG: hypothetical protein OXI27_01490 [Thaumarchaeota archaeon]|nr:hypothetical protein [Nitrososphaerota archaeon]MDE0525263.1 hypothetical protein [Nitrososphaerota archaeon]